MANKTNKKKSDLTPDEKRLILVWLIETFVECGYDIKPLVGRPLNYFNYYKVVETINFFRQDNVLDPIDWDKKITDKL